MISRMQPPRSLAATALALLTALLLAACSSSSHNSDAPTTTTTAPSATTVKPAAAKCDSWLPRADVTALFGAPAQTEIARSTSPGAKTCVYSWSSPDYVKSLDVSFTPGTAAYGCKILPNAKPVTTFGPMGCIAQHSITNALIMQFVKNGNTYSVLYNYGGLQGNKADPSDQVGQLASMVKAVAAKLG
jgi:hypothetical protein